MASSSYDYTRSGTSDSVQSGALSSGGSETSGEADDYTLASIQPGLSLSSSYETYTESGSAAKLATGKRHSAQQLEMLEEARNMSSCEIVTTFAKVAALPLVFVGVANSIEMASPSEGIWKNWVFVFFYFPICFLLFGLLSIKQYESLLSLDMGKVWQIALGLCVPGYIVPVGVYIGLAEAWKFPVPIGSLIASVPMCAIVLVFSLWRVRVGGARLKHWLVSSLITCLYLGVFLISVVFLNVIRELRHNNASVIFKVLVSVGYTAGVRVMMTLTGKMAASINENKRDEADLVYYTTVSWYKTLVLAELPEVTVFVPLLVMDMLLIAADAWAFSPSAHAVSVGVKSMCRGSDKPWKGMRRVLTRGPLFVTRVLTQAYVCVVYGVVYNIMYFGPNADAFIIKTTPEDDVARSMVYAAITCVAKIVAACLGFAFVSRLTPVPVVAYTAVGIKRSLMFSMLSLVVGLFIVTKFALFHTAAHADVAW